MQALWLENRQLALHELEPPQPVPGEAVVRVRLAGICGTDLALLRGYYPYTGVPGHEFVGEVVAAPDDPAWEGKRVVGEINAACRVCPTCRAGRSNHCPDRTVLGIVGRDGAFAEQLRLPLACLHEVPAGLSDEQAVFTEPLAAAARIPEQVSVRKNDRVLLLGAGRLGQLAARVLATTGCDLNVLARHPNQRAALTACDIALLDGDADLAPTWDVVVEATGTAEGFALARSAVRPGGTLVLNSTFPGTAEIVVSALVVDEITVVGSRCGPFPTALSLLAEGAVDPRPLIEAEYPLTEALEAFAHAARPAAFKVLLRM